MKKKDEKEGWKERRKKNENEKQRDNKRMK